MANIRDLLVARRSRYYQGAELARQIELFMDMIDHRGEVHEFPDATIVLEHDYLMPRLFRGWLLFDHFNRGVIRAMQSVSENPKGLGIIAQTHDVRISKILCNLGYDQLGYDGHTYHMVKKGKQNELF